VNTKKIPWYMAGISNAGTGLGQAQNCGRVN
jgi:hypothetical protein